MIFIPSGYSLALVSKKISTEISTASNIKDKNVGKLVSSALKSSLLLIKSYKGFIAPVNGLVLCAGEAQSYV